MAVRPNRFIERLAPYKITPQEPWLDYRSRTILKLDWNEGDFLPDHIRRYAMSLMRSDAIFSWYPDYGALELHEEIARTLGCSPLQVLSFPGSDVALDTVCRAFLDVGERALIVTPSYENFDVFVNSVGAVCDLLPLPKPYRFDRLLVQQALQARPTKLLYLVSPNNPCGYAIELDDIRRLCTDNPDTLVVCDQAYVEFAAEYDCVRLIDELPNLLINRTFSKAFSLAGLRLGYVVGDHELLAPLAKVRNGKNIGMLAQKVSIEMLRHPELVGEWVKEVIAARQWCYERLSELVPVVYPSHGNFLLFEVPKPLEVVAELKAHQIYIRDKTRTTGGGVRVSITSRRAMMRFIDGLAAALKEVAT